MKLHLEVLLFVLVMASSLGAQLQSRVMEVDAELLSLNVVGLRLIAQWLGKRSSTLLRKDRAAVLESVRQAIDQSGSAMSMIDRLEHLDRLRDKIREVMLEPDHWEQTPRCAENGAEKRAE